MLKLSSSIGDVKGVGNKSLQIFHKYGIETVFDFLLRFPVYYIDFATVAPKVVTGSKRLYRIEVVNWSFSRMYRRNFSVLKVKAQIIGSGEKVTIVFFNKPYLEDFFKANRSAYTYAQFELKNNTLQANTPVLYAPEDASQMEVEPVYTRIGTIKSGKLKLLVRTIFSLLEDEYENLPDMCLEKYGFQGIVPSLRWIHLPAKYAPEKIEFMKKRFIYNEFLLFQLELQYIRNTFKQVPRVHHYPVTEKLKAALYNDLPFELTADQQTACDSIMRDLQEKYAMQRLLQGDVGSGKTVVAFIALSTACAGGGQGAFLAPTEILASQHFNNARNFFKKETVELLTGSTASKKRKEVLERLERGEIDILFGTHALLTESVRFHRLSMVVIDEQHRFGVSQRAALYYKGNAVDLLVTTATPIPRTMLLSLYNDLSVSTIKTKPRGRLPIITKIRRPERRDEFYRKLRERLEKEEKAFIILPLIEKSDFFTELKDIESESIYFRDIFKGLPIGIVTGKTPAQEKDAMLEGMVRGNIRVLIATTVIEVGIDVKDATIIVIEDADRYGLSQLHQLRGRVGRGERQSYCYLFPSPTLTESGIQRLKTIAETDDGFEIAETDLKMRGGGIISGLQQSGYLDFKVADMRDHHDTFKEARQDAAIILADDSLQNDYVKDYLGKVKEKLTEINFS
jgi:ATP-dependent DNA helicase RecG